MEKLPFHLLERKQVETLPVSVDIVSRLPNYLKEPKQPLEVKYTPKKRPVSMVPNGLGTRNEEKPIVLSKDPTAFEYNEYFKHLRKQRSY